MLLLLFVLVDGDFKLVGEPIGPVPIVVELNKYNFFILVFGPGTLSGLLDTISGNFLGGLVTGLMLPTVEPLEARRYDDDHCLF